MITENIVMDKEIKKKLKHLAIDQNTHVSLMLVDKADKMIKYDANVPDFNSDSIESFTMKIDEDLKRRIKVFCKDKDIRIKDFWNEAARSIVGDEL